MRKSAINEFEIDNRRKENENTKLMLRNFYQTKNRFLNMVYHLRTLNLKMHAEICNKSGWR